VEDTIRETCTGFKDRYDLHITKLGFDQDHVHFLLQTLPKYPGNKIIRLLKSITARRVFEQHEEVKQKLWDGEFWTDGYYIATVSPYGSRNVIEKYIENQGSGNTDQLRLFNF